MRPPPQAFAAATQSSTVFAGAARAAWRPVLEEIRFFGGTPSRSNFGAPVRPLCLFAQASRIVFFADLVGARLRPGQDDVTLHFRWSYVRSRAGEACRRPACRRSAAVRATSAGHVILRAATTRRTGAEQLGLQPAEIAIEVVVAEPWASCARMFGIERPALAVSRQEIEAPPAADKAARRWKSRRRGLRGDGREYLHDRPASAWPRHRRLADIAQHGWRKTRRDANRRAMAVRNRRPPSPSPHRAAHGAHPAAGWAKATKYCGSSVFNSMTEDQPCSAPAYWARPASVVGIEKTRIVHELPSSRAPTVPSIQPHGFEDAVRLPAVMRAHFRSARIDGSRCGCHVGRGQREAELDSA